MDAQFERLKAALSDRYRIERELGRGGMATVYLADDLKHDRQVALKVLKPELAAVLGAERFLSEIRTTAHPQHPNIRPLFDSGEADGQPGSSPKIPPQATPVPPAVHQTAAPSATSAAVTARVTASDSRCHPLACSSNCFRPALVNR